MNNLLPKHLQWLAVLLLVLLAGPSATAQTTAPPNIIAAEYFIDNDPGEGLATAVTPSNGALDAPDESPQLDITLPRGLPIGPHYLFVRMKSSLGVWSTPRKELIVVSGERFVTAAEYFLDNPDTAEGKGIAMKPADGGWKNLNEAVESLEVSTAGLDIGLHTVYVRGQDQDGQWGPARSFTFQVLPQPVVAAVEYLISPTNNPAGDWKALEAAAGSTLNTETASVSGDIDTASLPRGRYTVWLRSRDDSGRVTGEAVSRSFDVIKTMPRLSLVADQLIRPGTPLSLRISATDSAEGSFTLSGAPTGMTIDARTGLISWTPGTGQASGTSQVTVQFSDGNLPDFKSVSTFAITLDPPTGGPGPALQAANSLNGSGLVDLLFTRPLDPALAADPGRYLVNGLRPASAFLRADGRGVVLNAASVSGNSFNIDVNGLKDTLGNALAASIVTNGAVVPMRTVDLGNASAQPIPDAAFATGLDGADVVSGGGGFLDRADSGRFVYEELSGDFDVRVNVAALIAPDYFSAAGLIAREGLDGGAKAVGAFLRPVGSGGVGTNAITGSVALAVVRTNQAGTAAIVGESAKSLIHPNAWLRLVRDRQTFYAYHSADGSTWTQLSQTRLALLSKLYVGYCAAAVSSDSTALARARFRNYGSVSPVISSPPLSQSVALGSDVTFGVTARGAAPLAFQWLFNGAPLTGANASTLRLTSVALANAGDYSVRVSNGAGAVTSPTATLDVGGKGSGGFEADVFPRPYGDNAVTVSDWVQIGRYVAGIDTPSAGELLRADCAPRETGGDGLLTVMDWAQAARYVVGLDPMKALNDISSGQGGGAVRSFSLLGLKESSPEVGLQLESLAVRGPGVLEVPVLLSGAGGANALGFSVRYDPALARFRSARLDSSISGATLQANANRAGEGQAGVVIGLNAGAELPAGERRLAWLKFDIFSGSEPLELAFSDDPVRRQTSDASVAALETSYADGEITFRRDEALALRGAGGPQMELSFATDAGRVYAIESSTDVLNWTLVETRAATGLLERVWLPSLATERQRFYRVRVQD